jgi:hypothetical protein
MKTTMNVRWNHNSANHEGHCGGHAKRNATNHGNTGHNPMITCAATD